MVTVALTPELFDQLATALLTEAASASPLAAMSTVRGLVDFWLDPESLNPDPQAVRLTAIAAAAAIAPTLVIFMVVPFNGDCRARCCRLPRRAPGDSTCARQAGG